MINVLHSTGLATAGLWAADVPTDTGSGILDALLKGGPFAVVLALIIFDKLGTNSERDRLREDNASLRDKNQELNDTIRKEVIAPLSEQNRLMAEVLKVLNEGEMTARGDREEARERDSRRR